MYVLQFLQVMNITGITKQLQFESQYMTGTAPWLPYQMIYYLLLESCQNSKHLVARSSTLVRVINICEMSARDYSALVF